MSVGIQPSSAPVEPNFFEPQPGSNLLKVRTFVSNLFIIFGDKCKIYDRLDATA